MAANANLHKAKDAKNDEFYTQLTDVVKELMNYKAHFKDKIVFFCNIMTEKTQRTRWNIQVAMTMILKPV